MTIIQVMIGVILAYLILANLDLVIKAIIDIAKVLLAIAAIIISVAIVGLLTQHSSAAVIPIG